MNARNRYPKAGRNGAIVGSILAIIGTKWFHDEMFPEPWPREPRILLHFLIIGGIIGGSLGYLSGRSFNFFASRLFSPKPLSDALKSEYLEPANKKRH